MDDKQCDRDVTGRYYLANFVKWMINESIEQDEMRKIRRFGGEVDKKWETQIVLFKLSLLRYRGVGVMSVIEKPH
jgi:hypothetical protein